ncbi:UNVERIFIED_CONTAM: GDP/GTP exchange factor for ARF, partial [Siphonaria sp. JEL0065]
MTTPIAARTGSSGSYTMNAELGELGVGSGVGVVRTFSQSSASSQSSPSKRGPLHPRPEQSWQHIVHSEIAAVTSAMRKNARWSLSVSGQEYNEGFVVDGDYNYDADYCARSQGPLGNVLAFTRSRPASSSGTTTSSNKGAYYGANERVTALIEGPLLAGFARLKARLTLAEHLRDVDPLILLAPFLDVIKSGDTTGPITGAALAAVEKFIKFRVLDPNHPALPLAMSVLTHTVANSKFEATDPASDEVVLTRILRLIRVTVMSEAGQRTLDDKAICEMVETAFGMCFQGRVSELLKRSAEQTLVVLVQVLFERLTQILKVKEHNDRLRLSTGGVGATPSPPSTIPASTSSNVTASNIFRSLKSRQKGEVAETVFASLTKKSNSNEEQHQHHSHNYQQDSSSNGPFVISIADSLTSSGNNEPEMISVGHDDTSSDLEIKLDLDLDQSDDAPEYQQQLEQKVRFEEGNEGNEGKEGEEGKEGKEVRVDATTAEQQPLLENDRQDDESIKSSLLAAPTTPTVTSAVPVDQQQHHHQQQQQNHRVFAPFGFPAILELIRVLVTLMDPRNRSHTDTTHRLIALTLLNVGIEVGGRSLGKWVGWGYEVELEKLTHGDDFIASDEEKMALACKELVVNELLKYLFQLLQNINMTYNSPPSSNNMTLLSLTLRVLTAKFQTLRHYLKFQFEFFLNWVMSKVDAGVVSWDVTDAQKDAPDQSTQQNVAGRNVLVAEARELLLETMVQCCRIPGFFTELWVNFDGDANCQGNLYEEVVRFLSK